MDRFVHHHGATCPADLTVDKRVFVLDMFRRPQALILLAATGIINSAGCGFDGFRRHSDRQRITLIGHEASQTQQNMGRHKSGVLTPPSASLPGALM
ncbi:hypothetical protein [Paracoccus albus]|uniref:hypothetical protein n=1 Tax=Paracoccus albus TaxID=3017784 RepID=UPI0022F05E39|nr:hypothetical protein [Paracoccus albus]WBU59258.1 hypothetical protein PAF20_10730 [Paracoccus albus]